MRRKSTVLIVIASTILIVTIAIINSMSAIRTVMAGGIKEINPRTLYIIVMIIALIGITIATVLTTSSMAMAIISSRMPTAIISNVTRDVALFTTLTDG